MNDRLTETYKRLAERYALGDVPWDDKLPPPEVIEFLAGLTPGRGLDLGCGFGRAAIYMASLNWEVDAIDFIPEAIEEAARRAAKAGVQVQFHLAEVTSLEFLAGPYDFALDVGCAHNLDQVRIRRYEDQLSRLLRKGGNFLLFARLRESGDDENEDGFSGLDENLLLLTFSANFDLLWSERGITEVADQSPWPSAWYHFRRR